MRWRGPILIATALMLPLAACQAEGDEAGTDEADIKVDAELPDEPDVIVEDREPDVIVEENEEGVSGRIDVDEEGNVSGGVDVNENR